MRPSLPSDEKECTIVVPDVGYNKVIVPTGPSGHIDIITDIFIRKIHSFTYWMVDLVDPPFPLNIYMVDKDLLRFSEVKLYLFLSEINLIDEVNNIFQTKFLLVRYWNDYNLDFMDLNKEDYLDEESQQLIWHPSVTFHNTLRKVLLNIFGVFNCFFFSVKTVLRKRIKSLSTESIRNHICIKLKRKHIMSDYNFDLF